MCVCVCIHTQLCPTLYNYSLPGSSAHGIIPARMLEWVAIFSSRGSAQRRDWTCISCIAGRIFYQWATREAHVWCLLDTHSHNIAQWFSQREGSLLYNMNLNESCISKSREVLKPKLLFKSFYFILSNFLMTKLSERASQVVLMGKKNLSASAGDIKRHSFNTWVRKIPWRKARKPSQYSCLENLTDRRAWRATQSLGLHRVGHDWSDLACMHILSERQATRKYFTLLKLKIPFRIWPSMDLFLRKNAHIHEDKIL